MSDKHPVICPCGKPLAPTQYPSQARAALAIHQAGRTCKLNREPCPVCKVESASKKGGPCLGCTLAAADQSSPLDLGGRWVSNGRGGKVWSAA